MLKSIWNKLINSGIDRGIINHANKKIRVINISLIISAFALNLFSLLNYYLGFYELILLDFLLSLVVMFCVYLNAKKRFNIAKFITFGILPSVFFIYPYYIGNIGAEYYYFFLLVVGFYIIDDRRVIYLFAIYIFILFVASKYVIYHNTFNDKYLILETVHYYPSIIASIIMVLIATYVFKKDTIVYQQDIESKNSELELYKDKVNKQNALLEERNKELANLHNDLTASLSYASHIQDSILLPESYISQYFQSMFILYQPKDIVSGDFYWFKDFGDRQLLAVVDCTGHGVPGAFMTAMGNTLLNEIVDRKIINSPGKILEELKLKLEQTLNQGSKENQVYDGMDIALCSINRSTRLIEFAGARRPLYQFRNSELIEHKSTRNSIDGTRIKSIKFETTQVSFQENDRFYMFSDGFPDQFGGKLEKKEKYLIKNFKHTLQNVQSQPMIKHKAILTQELCAWQNNEEQTDDILIIGFEV